MRLAAVLVGAETPILMEPVMEGAMSSVALIVCLPKVVKVTPFVNAWEPASFGVKR